MMHRTQPSPRVSNFSTASSTPPVVRIVPLARPSSFLASLRGPGLQVEEFRLHHRSLQETERQDLYTQLSRRRSASPDALIQTLATAEYKPQERFGVDATLALRACVLGFVLPKRVCKHAVRRNLIRRVMREGLRNHLLQAPDWPVEPPVLVLKLTRKLPERFSSAGSSPLGHYVRQQVQALLSQYSARRGRLSPARDGEPARAVPPSTP